MEPTDQEIIESLQLGGIAFPPVTWTPEMVAKRIQQMRDRVVPQYAGVLKKLQEGNGGTDYKELILLHICHAIALPLIKAGLNGQVGVTSASAGEVSVSYGALGGAIVVNSNFDLTEWGQELQRLRKAQGPFAAMGNGPPIRFR